MTDILNSPVGVVIGCLAGSGLLCMLAWWLMRRDQRFWQQRVAEDRRQGVLQQQVWDMENQIWDEQLSDEEREQRQQYRAQAAAIHREARHRLGLPAEDTP
jgi:hypothetical protein